MTERATSVNLPFVTIISFLHVRKASRRGQCGVVQVLNMCLAISPQLCHRTSHLERKISPNVYIGEPSATTKPLAWNSSLS